MDISQDTVDAAHLLSGYTAHDSDGNAVIGSYVPSTPSLQSKSVTYTPTSAQQTETVTADSGYDGLDEVNVTVNAVPPGTKGLPNVSVTKSSTSLRKVITYPSATGYFTRDDLGSDSYMTLESETVTPTESEQVVEPTSTSYYLDSVTVGAISSTYVGSGITRRSASDLSASGQYVSVPAGYYEEASVKGVSTMTLPTTTSTTQATGSTTLATIGRSTVDRYINISTGYNTASANYKISAVPNGTVTAPASISGTSATVSTGTNTLTLTKTVSVTPSVSTAGYVSSGTAGNSSVSLTASVTTKAAATYNTSTTDQTISASQYLTGAQTIKAVVVSGLSADKILSGTTVTVGDANDADRIASVSGSVVISHYYTGSSTPSSSLGTDGDIYLKTT